MAILNPGMQMAAAVIGLVLAGGLAVLAVGQVLALESAGGGGATGSLRTLVSFVPSLFIVVSILIAAGLMLGAIAFLAQR